MPLGSCSGWRGPMTEGAVCAGGLEGYAGGNQAPFQGFSKVSNWDMIRFAF